MKNAVPDIPEKYFFEEFIRPAAGPGGQHVNKTANGVRLHFLFRACPVLSDDWKARLARKAASCLRDDEIVIASCDSRSLQRNREEAKRRLQLLLEATEKPKRPRRPTKPTKASRERRLASKSRHSEIKRERGRISEE